MDASCGKFRGVIDSSRAYSPHWRWPNRGHRTIGDTRTTVHGGHDVLVAHPCDFGASCFPYVNRVIWLAVAGICICTGAIAAPSFVTMRAMRRGGGPVHGAGFGRPPKMGQRKASTATYAAWKQISPMTSHQFGLRYKLAAKALRRCRSASSNNWRWRSTSARSCSLSSSLSSWLARINASVARQVIRPRSRPGVPLDALSVRGSLCRDWYAPTLLGPPTVVAARTRTRGPPASTPVIDANG